MNHFLAKFKHWIESAWVSATTTPSRCESDSKRPILRWHRSLEVCTAPVSRVSSSFNKFVVTREKLASLASSPKICQPSTTTLPRFFQRLDHILARCIITIARKTQRLSKYQGWCWRSQGILQTKIVGTPLSMMAEGGNEGVSSRAFSSLGVAMIGAEKDSVAIQLLWTLPASMIADGCPCPC